MEGYGEFFSGITPLPNGSASQGKVLEV